MVYNTGDRLKYTAISGNNSTVMTSIPTADNTVTFTFTECKDGDNNYYPVVEIGNQLWMAENLKTTKFNQGASIPVVTDNVVWYNILESRAYCCWYLQRFLWSFVQLVHCFIRSTMSTKLACTIGWRLVYS
jgi:uncharacterized protein (TIGR02145 family)